MMEPSDAPDRMSCSYAALLLEKRISEEVLSDREQQALEHHLDHCLPCRDLVKWISVLPGYADELSETEIDSARYTVMENRGRLQRAEHRRKIGWTVVAAAAAVAAAVSVGGLLQSLLSKEEGDANGMLECSPVPLTEPVPGVVMTYCDDREPGVLIENGGEVRVWLRDGAVGLSIDPKRRNKHKVTVEIPQGEVRVKGTVFTVQVDRNNARVEVFRGVIEFVPAAGMDGALYVSAGQGADLVHHQIFGLSLPKTETLRRALDAEIAREDASEKAPVRGEAIAGPVLEKTSEPSESADSGESAGSTRQVSPVEQVKSQEEAVRYGTDGASKRSALSIDTLIQDAQSCLIARDWTCASSCYQDILKHYPGRPESTAVLVSLAKIELRRLNMPKKALDHYQSYQQRAPSGPMAEEALFGIAGAYRQLGKKDMEEETLRLFVERYPGSSQLERARARLHQLEADTPL